MAIIINTTDEMLMHKHSKDVDDCLQIYNALDCCITSEVFGVLEKQLDETTKVIYNFERALQAPALMMQLRGLKVDQAKRMTAILDIEQKVQRLRQMIDVYAEAMVGLPLNPSSPKQMQKFFYEQLKLPEQFKFSKGKRKVSTDRESLEKLLNISTYATPIIKAILAFADLNKKLGTLKTAVDSDGRLRASFNVAGTETGRFSSKANPFGTGTNLQNITDKLRNIFVADEGFKLAYIDLEQAESRFLGLICFLRFGAQAYLDACESGDLHTTVCRMIWKDLPWTGELSHDKKNVAEQPFYRQFSYRDMAKRGGHGTNYYGKPKTMAKNLKVDQELMEDFQEAYFKAFAEIPRYHADQALKLQTTALITTPMGRRRQFFGRLTDDTTLRTAIAYDPQSSIADYMNLGLLRVWQKFDRSDVQYPAHVLLQVHDAIAFLYREDDEEKLFPLIREELQVKIKLNDREFYIPVELACGWNWGKYDAERNPDGIRKWKGKDERKRTTTPSTSLLDTIIC